MSAATVRFHRSLVTALPGAGYRQFFYYPDEGKVDSWPLVAWAVYHEKPEQHECDEDGCECEGDDSAIVVGLVADGDGDVEEVGSINDPRLVGVLPEGQSFTVEEAASIYARKKKEEAERFARANARSEKR